MTIKANSLTAPIRRTILAAAAILGVISAYARPLTDSIPQEFRLTPAELKAFEGYYQFENNSNAHLQFIAKDNGLVAKQLWDEKEFFIVPKSAVEFYSLKEEFPTRFSKSSDGKIQSVLVFNRDTWKKVPGYKYAPPTFITLSGEKLKAFEGKYIFQFEPGKDSFIQITAYENYLVLTENWSGNKIRFSPLSELEFYSKERAFPLKFQTDKSGTVSSVLAFNRDLWTKVRQ